MTENKQAEKEKKQAEKETKKIVSEDVENFFRDVWGKVVEYASLGAEEATKVSATAKTRVDIETLKFKRGKVLKMLGERYWELVEKDPSLTRTEILDEELGAQCDQQREDDPTRLRPP